jgi:hypothetical protein
LYQIQEKMAKARLEITWVQHQQEADGFLPNRCSGNTLKTCDRCETHALVPPHFSKEQPAIEKTRSIPNNYNMLHPQCIPVSQHDIEEGSSGKEGKSDSSIGRVELNFTFKDVSGDIRRRRRLLVNVTSTSLKIYSLAEQRVLSELREISRILGFVKRIPDEIWYEILGRRIARDTHYWPPKKFKGVFLPSLTLSHVCSQWRRVIISSPSMWRSIHWNLTRGQEPNQELLKLWASRSQDAAPRIYERLRHSGLPTGALTHIRLGFPSHQKLRYYIHQDRSLSDHLGEDQPTSNCSFLLVRQSKSAKRVQTLQRRLLKMFTAIETLCLEGVTPKRGVVLPESLTIMAIGFYGPHESYSLRELLVGRLTFLKLIHFSEDGVPSLEYPVLLPNLVTLQITPLEHHIAAKLILPSIDSLRIFPQKPIKQSTDWVDSLIPHCANLRCLSLDAPTLSHSERQSPYDRLGAFRYLREHAARLRTLQFSDGSINGTGLADFLESDRQGVHSTIEELTIESCTGVSRMDCDRLIEVVDRLNVYRSTCGLTTWFAY